MLLYHPFACKVLKWILVILNFDYCTMTRVLPWTFFSMPLRISVLYSKLGDWGSAAVFPLFGTNCSHAVVSRRLQKVKAIFSQFTTRQKQLAKNLQVKILSFTFCQTKKWRAPSNTKSSNYKSPTSKKSSKMSPNQKTLSLPKWNLTNGTTW